MKHIFLQFGLILAILLTGCTKPKDAIINVSKKTTRYGSPSNVYDNLPATEDVVTTEDITIRVGDVVWDKKDGAWQGIPHGTRSTRIIYSPKDAKAIKAIDKHMGR